MQQWEYMVVRLKATFTGRYKIHTINGEAFPEQDGDESAPLYLILNKFGEEGWELSNFERMQPPATAIFKRPAAHPPARTTRLPDYPGP